ncbi:MAG: anti-sigma factor antagonist [Hyphomicrobiales bacterium]|nr:anti-sigma factor antagonist [Hyphomicrobiales bacterium]
METATITLSERLDVHEAQNVATALRKHRGENLLIDGSKVRHMGALALQTLISARKTWAKDMLDLRIVDASAALVEAVATLSMDNNFLRVERIADGAACSDC